MKTQVVLNSSDLEGLKKRAQKIHAILKELFPNPDTELDYKQPYELLFAVIMSAQTTDKQVNKVTSVLFEKYKKLEDFLAVDLETFQKDIQTIGLYRNKAKNILATAKILSDNFGGEVPKTMEELISLPGVARKTANVVLSQLYGINAGIAVDTHVGRLARNLGLTKQENPVKVEQDLMQLIPQEDWGTFSHRLILYGRYHWSAKAKTHDGPMAEFSVV